MTSEELIKGQRSKGSFGTRWQWSWEGETFDVQFAKTGEFFCKDYPRPGTRWEINGDKLIISWGDIGTFEMFVSVLHGTMEGKMVGKPSEQRRAWYVNDLEEKHGDIISQSVPEMNETMQKIAVSLCRAPSVSVRRNRLESREKRRMEERQIATMKMISPRGYEHHVDSDYDSSSSSGSMAADSDVSSNQKTILFFMQNIAGT